MCGLVWVLRKDGKPAAKSVLKRYRQQKGRGQEGFGYVAIKDNKVVSYQRAPTEHEITSKLMQEDAPEILFHHRFPTSTPNVEESAHPLLVESPANLEHQYFVAHNGVVTNPSGLKDKHTKKGFVYTTEMKKVLVTPSGTQYLQADKESLFNDSEALAIETALAMDGKQEYIGAIGSAAVIGLKMSHTQVVERFVYRNTSNPLYHFSDKVLSSLTSVGAGVQVTPSKVHLLTQQGLLEEHVSDVLTPVPYSYTPPAGSVSRTYLPAPTRTHSVHRNYNEAPLPYGDRYDDDELDLREYFDLPPVVDQDRASLGLVSHIKDIIDENDSLVRTLSATLLWREYDLAISQQEAVDKAIATVDDQISGSDRITDEQLEYRQTLQNKLDKIHAYQVTLDAEIDRRALLDLKPAMT